MITFSVLRITWTKLMRQKSFPKTRLFKWKSMVAACWSNAEIIHYNVLKLGKTITSVTYLPWRYQNKGTTATPLPGQQRGPVIPEYAQPHVSRTILQNLRKVVNEFIPIPGYFLEYFHTGHRLFKHIDIFLRKKPVLNEWIKSVLKVYSNSSELQILCYRQKWSCRSLAKRADYSGI